MDVKQFFKKNYIHFVAIGLFLVVGFTYFSLQLGDYSLKQHDIEAYKGVSAETAYNRDAVGESPGWNNSLFGGMPNTMISPNNNGNIFKSMITAWNSIFPSPLGIFLLHLICFYIFAMFLRIKPIIGIVGAFAFAFASYEIVILQAGHNTKAIAVAFLPAVLGAFIYTFKRNWKIGGILSALFLGLEVAANHLQVTYYMMFVLLALGIYFFIDALRTKEIKAFGFATGGLIAGYLLAALVNYSSLTATNDYAKYTIRGESDVVMGPRGGAEKSQEGLEIDYITNWSLDRGETFTFVSPYVRGSHSASFEGSRFEDLADEVELESGDEARVAPQLSMYWGDQPGTSGPFYMGVIVIFLAFLALLFVRKPVVYILFGVSILMVFLSWGKNLLGLTEFFVENIPLYNKFRTVTIILVIVELCMSVLAVLLLQHLYENREEIKSKRNLFFIGSGVFLVFLIGLKVSGGGFSGASDKNVLLSQEGQIRNQISRTDPNELREAGIDKNNPEQVEELVQRQLEPIHKGIDGAKKLRKELYAKSTTRSILFGILAIAVLSLFFFTSLSPMGIVAGLGVLILIDLVPVNLNYLGSDEGYDSEYMHWMEKDLKDYPIVSSTADEQIMNMELQSDPTLQAAIVGGEKFGNDKAEDLELEGDIKRRLVDFYKFRALAAKTNYRVIDLSGGWQGAWKNSSNAYLHKSLGGYHGAKLYSIQNLFDFHLSNGNNTVLDMMNVKYIIQGNNANPNGTALGNAWAVRTVKETKTADEEIRSLGKSFNIKNLSTGTLLVNEVAEKSKKVYGYENILYVAQIGDTVRVPMSNGITPGVTAIAARDVNGQVQLVPQQTLDADTLNSFVSLVEITGDDIFEPRTEAIMLEEQAKKLSKKEYSGEAEVAMTSFSPDKIEYEVAAKGKQLIVFSEIYYPAGWKATIDGKEVEILKANYLLRALEVDGGKHKVVFTFEEPGKGGAKVSSWIGSVLILLLLAGAAFMAIRNKKNEPTT